MLQIRIPIAIASLAILAILYIKASYAQQSRPLNTHDVSLSEPYKTHRIYELSVNIPASWKIDASFQEDGRQKHGSMLAIDESKQLSYPRNLEIRVIPESIHLDSTGKDHLEDYLKRKFTTGHRGIKQYKTDGYEFIKVANTEDAMLLFSSFLLGDDNMSHIHLAIPRNGYFFLFTYTDISSLIQSSSDSYNTFWNIVSHVKLPKRQVWLSRSNSILLFGILATLLLLALIGYATMHNKAFKKNLNKWLHTYETTSTRDDESDDSLSLDDKTKHPSTLTPALKKASQAQRKKPTASPFGFVKAKKISLDEQISQMLKHPQEDFESTIRSYQDDDMENHEETILGKIVNEEKNQS